MDFRFTPGYYVGPVTQTAGAFKNVSIKFSPSAGPGTVTIDCADASQCLEHNGPGTVEVVDLLFVGGGGPILLLYRVTSATVVDTFFSGPVAPAPSNGSPFSSAVVLAVEAGSLSMLRCAIADAVALAAVGAKHTPFVDLTDVVVTNATAGVVADLVNPLLVANSTAVVFDLDRVSVSEAQDGQGIALRVATPVASVTATLVDTNVTQANGPGVIVSGLAGTVDASFQGIVAC